jgi:hypothetical protein
MLGAMSQRTHTRSLRLTCDELDALVAALYVVKDNWWLTEIEERLLQRLELLDVRDGVEPEPTPLAA